MSSPPGSPRKKPRTLLATAKTGAVRSNIAHRLTRFYTWCTNSGIGELTRPASTIEVWWPEIEAFLRTGITNAATEGTNHLIKDAVRGAFGFRNPRNPAAPGTVRLHRATTPGHRHTRGHIPLNLESPFHVTSPRPIHGF
ncbi:MAG: hypothetical protein DLM58_04255 [Pseudonocardiales bacterium]|nr:MAG: hypothetical protein DLM58_04255 [Pseudonocardiales bacterium]